MPRFTHVRHKPPTELARPRELIVACPPMRSRVNLSRIVRAAGCCGVQRVIAAGAAKVDAEIARDALEQVTLEVHRSLPPVLARLKDEGYALIGLEQTDQSENLHEFAFPRRSVLVLGHERQGIEDDVLRLLDHAVEIPVYGRPLSYNAATAAAMALYEYCRQYPGG
jgi:tRNA G18 (ribose-2'-O)-methylase SpoU